MGAMEEDIRRELQEMLLYFQELFVIDKSELNKAQVEAFKITLSDERPYVEKLMRYNAKLSGFIDKEVESLLEKGLVYLGESDYVAKVILAPKGDTQRMCIDYKGINMRIVSDRYPLPNNEDVYNSLSRC